MKLDNAIKLLSQYGEVKINDIGATIEINNKTYGARTNCGEKDVMYLFIEYDLDMYNRFFYTYHTLKHLKDCIDRDIAKFIKG